MLYKYLKLKQIHTDFYGKKTKINIIFFSLFLKKGQKLFKKLKIIQKINTNNLKQYNQVLRAD